MSKIELRIGNMLDDDANVLINPSNTSLLLGSGVSMAFKRKFGVPLQNQMNIIKEENSSSQGDVFLTKYDTGEDTKYIYHCCVMNYSGVGTKQPSLQTIDTICNNLKEKLQELPDTKLVVAIPFIGCGVGGLNISDVTKIYIDKFSQFEDEVLFRLYGYTQDDCMEAYKILEDKKA